jgi:hypothetical protein
MPRFLVTHEVRRVYESQEAWVGDWEGLKRRSLAAIGVTWLSSWYSAEGQRLYCEWEGPDAQAIRACFGDETLDMAPITRIDEVVAFDPAWLASES